MAFRILIADDNPSVRAAMRQVLEAADEHWEVIEAEDGVEAVTKAQDAPPNLIILDLAMPQADGLTASRELAKLLPDVPILVHTLYYSSQVEFEAGKIGVRRVVPKSESGVLLAAIQDVLHPKVCPPSEASSEAGTAQAGMPVRRSEDRIRELCNQLFTQNDEKGNAPLVAELRAVLHRHIEQLRARIAAYPVLERRVRSGVPPPHLPDLMKDAGELSLAAGVDANCPLPDKSPTARRRSLKAGIKGLAKDLPQSPR